MSLERRIRDKLAAGLSPSRLDVINDSHAHSGHAGDNGTGQTHFTVHVAADRFRGLGRLERHRIVNALLIEEFRDGVHALSIRASTPEEAAG